MSNAAQEAGRVRTGALLQRLYRTSNLKHFFQSNEHSMESADFCAYINRLAREKGEAPERIILRGGIERTFGHQLFNGTRNPSRDKVIQLAFGFEMNVEQTQHLLQRAGRSSLYPRIKRDAAILFCLNRRASFLDTQVALQELGLSLLGGTKNE